jgi:hypothetical protein
VSESRGFQIQISSTAYVLVVFLLALGALIAAGGNITGNSVVRPQFTADHQSYSDSLIKFDYPLNFTLTPLNTGGAALVYQISMTPNALDMAIVVGPTSKINTQITTDASPADFATAFFKQYGVAQPVTKPVTIAGLNGVEAESPITLNNVQQTVRIAVLSLDAKNSVVLLANSSNDRWTSVNAVYEEVAGSLQIDQAGTLLMLNGGVATSAATSAVTSAATVGATLDVAAPGTLSATLAATMPAASISTLAPTANPTAQATVAR